MTEVALVAMVGSLSIGCWQVLEFCRDPIHAWNQERERLQIFWTQEAANLYALKHREDARSVEWMILSDFEERW